MQSHVSGAPRPRPGPTQTVVQLAAGEKLDCVILSNAIWGVGTHWNDRAGNHGRSERCTKEHGECSGCNAELPCRWKGYLHVFCFMRRRAVFVELTPASAESIDLQAFADRPLRGQRLKLKRGEGGKKTRIEVEVVDYHGDDQTLPAEADPEPILESLWKWRR
jgi:hypothetical protein